MPYFSNGLGSNPSVDSSTVLSPVSGSAGLVCAQAAPDGTASRRAAMIQKIFEGMSGR